MKWIFLFSVFFEIIFYALLLSDQDVIKGFCDIRSSNERSAAKRTQKSKSHSLAKKPRTDEECEADIERLKSLAVNRENIDEIKTKLIGTLDYRLKLINEMKMDLLETFPYFFTDPDLVCFKYTTNVCALFSIYCITDTF